MTATMTTPAPTWWVRKMALDSTWWATGYADIQWDQDWSAASSVNNILGGGWSRIDISDAKRIVSLSSMGVAQLNSKEYGYFYGLKDGGADTKHLDIVRLDTAIVGDPDLDGLLPKVDDVAATPKYHAPGGREARSTTLSVDIWWYSDGAATYSIRHYQPAAWFGNPCEVAAAILRYCGLSTDFIDMTAWSNTHDEQSGLTPEPMLMYVRRTTETVADAVMRIVRHCTDLLCINMAGKIALVSRDDPPTGPTALVPADCIGPARWRYASEHLTNYCEARHGQWNYYQLPTSISYYPGLSTWGAASQWEPNAESDSPGLLVTVYEDSTSQSKYGLRVLDNSHHEILEGGQLVRRPAFHVPYYYDEDYKDWLLGRIASSDCYLRRELILMQDLRGLDYDIGYKVAGIEVTSDGDEITDARCICKRIDFRSLTVESVLLEEP